MFLFQGCSLNSCDTLYTTGERHILHENILDGAGFAHIWRSIALDLPITIDTNNKKVRELYKIEFYDKK